MISEIELQDDVPRERLSIEQIDRRFAGEWVLINEPETRQSGEVVSGFLIWRSKERDEVYDKLGEFALPHVAVRFTGPNLYKHFLL
jgi:hypothetical protein